MSKQEIFSAVYNDASVESIEFNEAWSNGTGYFDFAVYGEHAPTVKPGTIVKSVTPGNRRMLIVGTLLGNVAVFDRYYGNAEGVFVYNTTSAVERTCMIRNKSLDEENLIIILGASWDNYNIGERIQAIFDGCKKREGRAAQPHTRRE